MLRRDAAQQSPRILIESLPSLPRLRLHHVGVVVVQNYDWKVITRKFSRS